jgi:phosphoserine phosphatase
VLPAEEATAVVTYVVGPAVESWRDRAGAVEIARAEPATGDRAEYARLRARVIDDLERDGLDGLTEQVDGNLLGLGIDPRLRPATVELLRQMIELSGPTSVFVTAPGS